MATLIMMCGLPGSGKSTFAKKRAKSLNLKYVSRDMIRFALSDEGEEYFAHEEEVYDVYINTIRKHLINNETVIADATHLTRGSRRKLLNRLSDIECHTICAFMDVDPDIAKLRNNKRTGIEKVPPKVLNNMISILQPPEQYEFDTIFYFDENGMVKL